MRCMSFERNTCCNTLLSCCDREIDTAKRYSRILDLRKEAHACAHSPSLPHLLFISFFPPLSRAHFDLDDPCHVLQWTEQVGWSCLRNRSIVRPAFAMQQGRKRGNGGMDFSFGHAMAGKEGDHIRLCCIRVMVILTMRHGRFHVMLDHKQTIVPEVFSSKHSWQTRVRETIQTTQIFKYYM